MKFFRLISVMLALNLLLFACSMGQGSGFSFGATPTPLATPAVKITSTPDAQEPVQAYLDAFAVEDYESMYAMLTQVSRERITLEDFSKQYVDALNTMSAASFETEILSALVNNPYSAQVAFRVVYHTALVGDLSRDIVVSLNLEDGAWRIQWDSGLILPELAGGNRLAMDYQIPARGDIYDKDGSAVVTQAQAIALGIDTGALTPESASILATELSQLCGINRQDLVDEINAAGFGWYIPVCEVTVEKASRILALYPSGLQTFPYESRFYHQRADSNVVGYTQFISAEELDEWRRKGYQGSERVGASGIEKWGEDYLAGKHGGSLYIVNPETGQIVSRIANSDPEPAASIYLTLDQNLQFYAQQALTGFRGAVVVLERDTGRVLALASSPGFDANLFEPENYNNSALTDLLNDPRQPLVNRATQGQYPPGSVFKVVTFAAALESGLFEPETTLDCQYEWTVLTDQVRYDWTYEHCQDRLAAGDFCDTSDSQPSGLLTLPEGLMRSCNPWFWQIGYDLNSFDRSADIAKMARAFGFGAPTGIEQVSEASGQINDPTDVIQVVNQAIGQGDVLATPLQVAVMMAAIGNGGTLYRPQLVERIVPISGDPISAFKPEARGTLPLRPDNLEVLQDALWMVIHDSRGTANFSLRGFDFPARGKTGTAESGSGDPHAWFSGYTDCSDYLDEYPVCEGKPDIAIAVIVENAGEGSEFAAPIFRRMVQVHYWGSPQSLFPWEASYGVPKTPTPIGGIPTRTRQPDDN
ncbi:MAG: penicillin-binding protein 2 [Anaerolineales bacterium]